MMLISFVNTTSCLTGLKNSVDGQSEYTATMDVISPFHSQRHAPRGNDIMEDNSVARTDLFLGAMSYMLRQDEPVAPHTRFSIYNHVNLKCS